MTSEGESLDPAIEKFQKAVKLTALMRQKPTSDEEMQKAQKALFKPYQIRNSDDFEAIERVMIRVKFFTKVKLKYGLLVFKEVCKHLYYKRAQPDHIIIKINNEGRAFYVILRGSVGINIFLPKFQQKKAQNKGLVNMEEIELENEPFEYQEVNVLQNGDSFGEMALLDPTSKTTATVITKEICEFACLDKEQFTNILGALNQAEMNEKMSFVRNIHFLKGWFENDLKTLSFHFDLVTYERNDMIYKEGDNIDGYLYFMKKGEVSLMKVFQRSQISVCNLCVGEIFGEEMYLNIQSRFHSAICNVQDTQLYRLAKSDLDKRMWQIENRNLFKDSITLRWEWRNNRFDGLKVIETKVEQEENLQQYLKPKTEVFCETLPQKFLSQPSTTKISSYTFTKPFNFMEPEETAEIQIKNEIQTLIQSKIKTRQQNYSRQSQRTNNHKKQLSLTLNNSQKKKDTHFEKVKRVNIQQFRSFLLHKFASEELIQQKRLPFNFINQETINEDAENQQSMQSKPQSSQKQLYEEVSQFIVMKKQQTQMKLPFANTSKFSSKDISFKKSPLELLNHRKSPSNLSYEFSEAKNSFKYKRLFQF